MPKMKTIIVDNSTSITEALIKENIAKTDMMQDTNKALKVEISRVAKHSEILKKSNEELDSVMADLEKRLTQLSEVEVDAKYVEDNVVVPKDNEVSAYAVKCHVKYETYQELLMGIKNTNNIEDIDSFLNSVRETSRK